MKTTLNALTHRIVCLNWEGAPERWQQTQEECQRVGLAVERWPGADKRRLPDLPKISSGQLACTLGHLSIAEALLESGDPAWLVLEDDVVFCQNFATHWKETELEVPEDWDFLFLGSTWRTASIPVSPRLHRLESAYSTHAYLMTAGGAHAWIRAWLRHPRRIADHYLNDLMKPGGAGIYGLVPYWAVQRREAVSGINNRVRDKEYDARFGGWFEDDHPVVPEAWNAPPSPPPRPRPAGSSRQPVRRNLDPTPDTPLPLLR